MVSPIAAADEKLVDKNTIAICMKGKFTGRDLDVCIDLAKQEISGTDTLFFKTPHNRKLEPIEVTELIESFDAAKLTTSIQEKKEVSYEMSGGSSYFEIKQQDGSIRTAAIHGTFEEGRKFIELSADVAAKIHHAFPNVKKRVLPPTFEAKIIKFLNSVREHCDDPRFKDLDHESLKMIDPDGTKLALNYVAQVSPKEFQFSVQLNVLSPSAVDLSSLITALDVESPSAFLPNTSERVWHLASLGKPLGKWGKYLIGHIKVRLSLPPSVKLRCEGQLDDVRDAKVIDILYRSED